MRKSDKTIQEQESIIAEYLLGDTTYRKLGAKHSVDFRAVHHWVTKFQGKEVKRSKPKIKLNDDLPKEELPTDVKQLQEELPKRLILHLFHADRLFLEKIEIISTVLGCVTVLRRFRKDRIDGQRTTMNCAKNQAKEYFSFQLPPFCGGS